MMSDFHIITIKRFFLSFIIFLINISISQSANCKENPNVSNKECFTDVIKFDSMRCRAGHSSINKDGVFIMELSDDAESGKRVFYGLKPNGRYYFPNESPTKEITLTGKTHGSKTIIARYESINSFISLKNDLDKEKEYFLSISTYYCFMEIYDLTQENLNYNTIYTYDYLSNQIFSFKFELLETKYSGTLTYYLVFCHGEANQEAGNKLSVKKIEFSSLSFNNADITATKTMDGKQNDRTVTAFLVDDVNDNNYKILGVIYLSSVPKYYFNIYSLSDLSQKHSNQLYGDNLDTGGREAGYGLFFKVIYLGNQDLAMAYFLSNRGSHHPRYQTLTIKTDDGGKTYYFPSKIYYEINENLRTDLVLNDFINITKTRLAFISTTTDTKLFILIIDLFNDNKNAEMRKYEYELSPHKFAKELSGLIYYNHDNYLAFTSAVDNSGMYSIFMIFGFANGTDFTINISPHLMDTGEYTTGNDLVTRLLKNMTIDNNIFGYVPIEKIILVSYPPELLFYYNDGTTPIPNGTIIDNTHILNQNTRLNKTHRLYYKINKHYPNILINPLFMIRNGRK